VQLAFSSDCHLGTVKGSHTPATALRNVVRHTAAVQYHVGAVKAGHGCGSIPGKFTGVHLQPAAANQTQDCVQGAAGHPGYAAAHYCNIPAADGY
jgi:hypothetical protein